MNIFKLIVWPVIRTIWPVVLVVIIAYISYKWIISGGPERLYYEIVWDLEEWKERHGK